MDRSDFAACAACVALALITGCGTKAETPRTVAGTPTLLDRDLPSPAPLHKAPIKVTVHEEPVDDASLHAPVAGESVANEPAAEMSALADAEASEAAGAMSDASADAATVDGETPAAEVPLASDPTNEASSEENDDELARSQAEIEEELRAMGIGNSSVESADGDVKFTEAADGLKADRRLHPAPVDAAAAAPGQPLDAAEPQQLAPPMATTAPQGPIAPPQTALPWAPAPQRSAAMEAVSQRADERVRHGFQLAERNAIFSARTEFVAALQLICQANDSQQNQPYYTRRLAAGLAALREAGDFLKQSATGKEIKLASVVKSHRTPILKDAVLDDVSPFVAAQRYYTFAQEQLALAAVHEPAGSMALYGLGKVALAEAEGKLARKLEVTAQAMALYQAALITDARNFRAANELGVILAQNGDALRARDLLIHSVRLSQQPATHHNLAAVHARLGEMQLAEYARAQAIALERAGMRRAGPAVQWVDPATFASTATASDAVLPPVPAPVAPPAAAPEKTSGTEKPAANVAKKGISDWLPWTTRR